MYKYKIVSLINLCYFSQTIPHGFVSDNHLQQYQHAILRRMESERRVVLKHERHAQQPWRNNHMTLRTNWRTLADEFQFRVNKMIRFQIVGEVVDDTQVVFHGEDPVMMPVFHVC